jgi:hypothetical protein
MGRMPLAARGLRPYGTRPEWVSLRSVRNETLAGRRGPMTSPTISDTTKPQGSMSRMARLRRVLMRPAGRRPTTQPVVRRVWREVAPGEWRWLHVDQATK